MKRLLFLLGVCYTEKLLFGDGKHQWKSQFSNSQSDGWEFKGNADPQDDFVVIFGLKQRNLDLLESTFWRVSNPRDAEYGHHLTVDHITSMVGHSQSTIISFLGEIFHEHFYKVSDFFANDKKILCQCNRNMDWVTCQMPTAVAMEKFQISEVCAYSRPSSSRRYLRTGQKLTFSSKAASMVDYVGGAVGKLPVQQSRIPADSKTDLAGKQMHIGVYPTVIRERYNLTNEVGGKSENNSQCTPQFLEQFYHSRDLSVFWKIYGKDFVHKDDIDIIIGDVDTGLSGIEASLDTQYIMSIGNNITTWFWYTAGRHEKQEPFLQWLIDLNSRDDAPLVNSASYSDKERTVSPDYMKKINIEFMKAGVRGLTLLFASGDDGAGCHKEKFEPQFPSSSPYITTVGGTAFIKPFGIGEEKGYDISGGGFSNFFQMPGYQVDAVKNYFEIAEKKNLPPVSYYNQTGRGYPDLAAISNHYWVVNNMVPVPGVLGTSASCPVVAAILAHVNDYRLSSNKPPLGFINPLIYQNENVMTDVTKGYNAGCDLSEYHDRGFYCEKGWDPVTGLGNPNFPTLLELAMNVGRG